MFSQADRVFLRVRTGMVQLVYVVEPFGGTGQVMLT